MARCKYKSIRKKLERGLRLIRAGRVVEGFRVLADLLRELDAEIARLEARDPEPGLTEFLGRLYADFEASRGVPPKENWARDAAVVKRCLAWLSRAGVPEDRRRQVLRDLWVSFLSRYPVKSLRGLPAFEVELPVLFRGHGASVSPELRSGVKLSESED